ncbi:PH domain-containing protein [Streptomyces sp. NPDC001890]|uniref:PH domain-containing protein n=1 Tax=Streptomyces sp. NPDC001890 TaxID=3364620 RepID=UPI0036A083DE
MKGRSCGARSPLPHCWSAGLCPASGQTPRATGRPRIPCPPHHSNWSLHLRPVSKDQGVGLLQGPWQRNLRLATVRIDLADGPRLNARHRDTDEAAVIAAAGRASGIDAH